MQFNSFILAHFQFLEEYIFKAYVYILFVFAGVDTDKFLSRRLE